MAKQTFKEITAIEAIEPLANGVVQVKEATTVYKGDLVIAKTVHRWCLEPAQDISDQEPECKRYVMPYGLLKSSRHIRPHVSNPGANAIRSHKRTARE